MNTRLPSLLGALALCWPLAVQPARATTLDLVFLPPVIEKQDICNPEPREEKPDDLTVEGDDEDLSNAERLRFLRRDIRRLRAEGPDEWFDFILTLIDWRAELDPSISPVAILLEKIGLHVDAGRLDALTTAGLIAQVRAKEGVLTSAQRLVLAHYYMGGVAVERDVAYANELIRTAALAGNADALLDIARMEIEGNPMPGWEAPLDITVTLAFGGMLGQMDAGVCGRAGRIAREYFSGGVVTANPDVALAWYRFAADLGGAQGAWKIVEHHLNADAAAKDNAEMLDYLRLAVQRGIALEDNQIDRLITSGGVDLETLRTILGFNHSAQPDRLRPSVAPYFQLAVNIDGDEADDDNLYVKYLRELTRFENAPGWVYTYLARELLVARGRWAAEPEALDLLEIAAERDDPEGMRLLAKKLVRQRDNPAQLQRAINLLSESVTRHGWVKSMDDLDTLYRCQANDAPRLEEADLWAANYRATLDATLGISATDLIKLDPFREPIELARLQSQALDGRAQSLANYLQRVQVDPFSGETEKRLWAARLDSSNKALEEFAKLEFELATNPAERHLAVELFRRIYLNNGVTTALDLAITLTEDNARDPAIADEIIALLTKAGNRGEGASIRLKARLLTGRGDSVSTIEAFRSVFEEFEDVIEERGDFLALMFAIPYVSVDKVDDYIDRAVSLMNCGTKDADELGDAYAIRLAPDLSYHWRRIGLTFEGGHVLSKLRLSDLQMKAYRNGRAPDAVAVYRRILAEGGDGALQNLFVLTADPDLPSYDPNAAAGHLLAVLERGAPGDDTWALSQYHGAVPAVQAIVAQRIDIAAIYRRAAQTGDVAAQLDYGLFLRETATTTADLLESARWLGAAAKSGNVAAMRELGLALMLGLGGAPDGETALTWLDQAAQAGDAEAADMARLLRLRRAR